MRYLFFLIERMQKKCTNRSACKAGPFGLLAKKSPPEGVVFFPGKPCLLHESHLNRKASSSRKNYMERSCPSLLFRLQETPCARGGLRRYAHVKKGLLGQWKAGFLAKKI